MFKALDGGKAFCNELVKGFEEPIKILECTFAEPPEKWKEKFIRDQAFFEKNLLDIKLDIQLADPASFIQQVEWAHVIYLRGGENARLIDSLKQSKEWATHLSGKTVVGTSAGASVLAKYYYSVDHLTLGEGLGLVPIKVLVHYQSSYNAPRIHWEQARAELQAYKENIPILTLREGEFKVIEK